MVQIARVVGSDRPDTAGASGLGYDAADFDQVLREFGEGLQVGCRGAFPLAAKPDRRSKMYVA